MGRTLRSLRKIERDDSGEWTLTLADMMTLILCFFVLIVAISVVDFERYEKVSESMSNAMTKKKAPQRVKEEAPEPLFPAEVRRSLAVATERRKSLDELLLDLQSRLSGAQEAVELEKRPNSVAINLKGPVFFELGSADLTAKAGSLLRDIFQALEGVPYKLVVEGHSDNIPIRSAKFPSNWELSSARACSVARYLIDSGFPSTSVSVLGLADTRPLAPNSDPLGRPLPQNQVLNRRVVILVEPKAS
ncbi:MAG: flagellar motor protein MotB [Desulfovibrionaceae bacterium]